MLTYEQWDHIADSYIPLLVSCIVCRLAVLSVKQGFKNTAPEIVFLLSAVFFVYLLMFLDNTFSFWARYHSDYSKHTAVALVLVYHLSTKQKFVSLPAIASMLLYCVLMLYQQYHTLVDLVSTALFVFPALPAIQWSTGLLVNKSVMGHRRRTTDV